MKSNLGSSSNRRVMHKSSYWLLFWTSGVLLLSHVVTQSVNDIIINTAKQEHCAFERMYQQLWSTFVISFMNLTYQKSCRWGIVFVSDLITVDSEHDWATSYNISNLYFNQGLGLLMHGISETVYKTNGQGDVSRIVRLWNGLRHFYIEILSILYVILVNFELFCDNMDCLSVWKILQHIIHVLYREFASFAVSENAEAGRNPWPDVHETGPRYDWSLASTWRARASG